MTWVQVQTFPFYLFFFLPQPTDTDTDSVLLKSEAKRKETHGMPRDLIPLSSQNLGELPVPKTLLSREKELGTNRIILRCSGKLMEKDLFPSN